MPLQGTPTEMSAYNLYLTSTYSMSHAKRSKPTIVRRPFSDVEPFVVSEVALPRHPPQATAATVLYVCTASQTFYTPMRMSNGKPELGSPWSGLSKLVGR